MLTNKLASVLLLLTILLICITIIEEQQKTKDNTSMIENEFYPTPKPVIHRMLAPYTKLITDSTKVILEPSAGKGDILDSMMAIASGYHKAKRLAIEIDPELRLVLTGKGHNVIASDFLSYSEPVLFDLIVMNPPFSHGANHVLKAWDLLTDGGELCALVNWETINNCYSKERLLLKQIIDNHGSVENLGAAFASAEIKTDVVVGLIRLKKPGSNATQFDFNANNFGTDSVTEQEFESNPLAHTNVIKNLVAQYNACLKILQDRNLAQSKLDFYLNGIADSVYGSVDQRDGEALEQKTIFSEQIHILKSRFWNTVFSRTKIGKRTTSKFQQTFQKFSQSQSNMAFTEENILEMLSMFFDNRQEIMKQSVVALFDISTKYHEKNIIHTEGWKTNKSWKISKKIIVPYGISYESKWNSWSKLYGYKSEYYDDMDRILCWLSGTNADSDSFVGINTMISNFVHSANKGLETNMELESTFFKIKVFKKGTVHLVFKDLDLLAQFNRVAADGKQWLGAGY